MSVGRVGSLMITSVNLLPMSPMTSRLFIDDQIEWSPVCLLRLSPIQIIIFLPVYQGGVMFNDILLWGGALDNPLLGWSYMDNLMTQSIVVELISPMTSCLFIGVVSPIVFCLLHCKKGVLRYTPLVVPCIRTPQGV